jgi:three-Cys-motif partner protein
MSNRLPVIWDADPHTIAKIEILKAYLHAWFRILGTTRPNQTLLYVDGFSGPGYYRNHPEGSPLAAVKVAEEVIKSLGGDLIASRIHCAFIEENKDRFDAMSEAIAAFESTPKLAITRFQGTFVDGIRAIQIKVPEPFRGKGPLFIFADPFGGTDTPFKTFEECSKGDTAELLINLDADGIGRIFFAHTNNGREKQLTELFGSECWREELKATDLKQLSVEILDLYKERLRTLPGMRFIWSFAMRGKKDSINYHLVFATKHPLGLGKMKEAMKQLDKTGSYSFSDAHIDQHVLFRSDDGQIYSERLFTRYNGRTVSMNEITEYALNETPFINAKTMLLLLEESGRVKVAAKAGEKVRAGSFPEEKIDTVTFGRIAIQGKQGDFEF